MNAKDKLKFLMGAKARRMWLLGVKNWHLYYGPEDAEEIERWDEGDAEKVWKDIYREVANYASGLSPDTCPFCRYYSWIRDITAALIVNMERGTLNVPKKEAIFGGLCMIH